jgi:ATP-dependent protease ClpP protease subunit
MHKENKTMGLLDSMLGGDEKDMFSNSLGTQFDYYLSGAIESPEQYTDMFHQIRNATGNDTITLHINSPGGSLATALQFFRCLGESPARIIASIEGECMSAATIIMMQADAYLISPHSMFMVHNYSGGVFGKGGEMMDQLEFERLWSTNLLHDVYKDFLTEDEINTILDNRDIWLTSDEVSERLQFRAEAIAKENEEMEEEDAK